MRTRSGTLTGSGRRMRSKRNRRPSKSVIYFSLACAALFGFFLFRWTSTSYLPATPERVTPVYRPSSDLREACLFALKHFHEVLTDWMGGRPSMSERELWDELRMSEDVVVQLMDGSQVKKEGLLSLLVGKKGSSIGFATKPVNITWTEVDPSHIMLEFKELQAFNKVVVTVLRSMVMCRERASSSGLNNLEAEIYLLEEHVEKLGEDAALHSSQMDFA